MKKSFVFIAILSCCLLLFCGCTTKVQINTLGGEILDIDPSNASMEELLESVPVKEGYIFGGWYSTNKLTTAVNVQNYKKIKPVNIYAKWITADTHTFLVREAEASITDSGRINQKLDIAEMSSFYDMQGLLFAGYKTYSVKITIDICEIDDGYQYIFLYNSTKCASSSWISDIFDKYISGANKEDPDLLFAQQIEHGSGYLNSNWATYQYEMRVNISDIRDNLFIRYGASGKDSDTWHNKNVSVEITPEK